MKKLLLLELNEINFDLVGEYVKNNRFPNLKKLLDKGLIITKSEDEYDSLEPWIQWVSVHTGKELAGHNIFRLGDVVNSDEIQIFEKVEKLGYGVGCISPMNTKNNLQNPAYFVPDPWTNTNSDDSFWSLKLTSAVKQAVNDNAKSKISFTSMFYLACGLLRFAKLKNYNLYMNLVLSARKKPWNKALFLDLFLSDIHTSLFKNNKVNFSTLFLNAGAHIQHHYMFNSKQSNSKFKNPAWYLHSRFDPVEDMLSLYDKIVGEILGENYELILATGLSQVPYDGVKYYWRLKEHERFLEEVGLTYKNVYPRMTRDFLIEFNTKEQAKNAELKLADMQIVDNQIKIFNEIDNRGSSLFVTLTYPHEIKEQLLFKSGDKLINLANYVSFVAIKNGMHSPKGYMYLSDGVTKSKYNDGKHVAGIHDLILRYFTR